MSKRSDHIPVYTLPPGAGGGIMFMRDSFNGSPGSDHVERPHRDSGYTFILQEQGVTHLEVDFEIHCLAAPAVICIRPGQVHRVIGFEVATISTWMITAENLRPDYITFLNKPSPVNALKVTAATLGILADTAAICLKLFNEKDQGLGGMILQDSCNALVGMVAAQYTDQAETRHHASRYEAITNSFKQVLEQNFKTLKSPAAYAEILNLSTSYLNECVKGSTGQPVSGQIQQRVVLEAKRLLYHSSQSVKEIAAELGYDDYSYFSRLFVKIIGITPISFRTKNRD